MEYSIVVAFFKKKILKKEQKTKKIFKKTTKIYKLSFGKKRPQLTEVKDAARQTPNKGRLMDSY